MMPQPVKPVKLLAGLLYSDATLLEKGFSLMESRFGKMDYLSSAFSFSVSDYYVPEMGSPIFRKFISFEPLGMPDQLADFKLLSNQIEEQLSIQNCRKVNIDIGYMDFDKVVLASAKYNGQKIYLKEGIWADLTLQFYKGTFRPYPWSFPDFKTDAYQDVFLKIRHLYKKQMKIETVIE